MDLLFKIFTLRNMVILAALGVSGYAADYYQEYPRRWYREWRYPPQKGITPGGEDILIQNEKREAKAVQRRYERVTELLAQAQKDGFAVDKLRRKAAVALTLNTPQYRRQAVKFLVEVEMAAPRKKVQYIPMYPANEDEDLMIPEDVPGKRVGKRRVK